MLLVLYYCDRTHYRYENKNREATCMHSLGEGDLTRDVHRTLRAPYAPVLHGPCTASLSLRASHPFYTKIPGFIKSILYP